MWLSMTTHSGSGTVLHATRVCCTVWYVLNPFHHYESTFRLLMCVFLYNAIANSATQPSQVEVEDMARRAAEVIHLLSEYKRAVMAEGSVTGSSLHHPHPYAQTHGYSHAYTGVGMGLPSPAPEENDNDRDRGGVRAPKRPWEDVAQESDEEAFVPGSASAPAPKFGGALKRDAMSKPESVSSGPMGAGGPMTSGRGVETDKERSAAEKDMALIRSKRATNVATLGPGAPKGKYRKRSVSHSHPHFVGLSADD